MIRLQNNYAITSSGGSFALVTFVKGKDKEDYIGQVGSITHTQKMLTGNGSATNLFDIIFEDGARFCVEREQIEFMED